MWSSPRRALVEYAQPLQAALHCVTPAALQYVAEQPGVTEMLRVVSPAGALLRRRDPESGRPLASIHLRVDHHVSTLLVSPRNEPRRYRMVTLGYNYAVLEHERREVLSFHWHPDQRSHVHDPHLHVGSAIIDTDASDFGRSFSRFHIPTGHMTLARVVRMLITEFNVVPNRQDWEDVLDRLLAVATDES